MIGEIRDTETAAIAVQASITGHLVVSTLHTNDTASSVTRLLDMGVESYLIADSVVGIIAQRLVRRLCPHCKRERQITAHEAEYLGVTDIDTIYEPAGCQRCGNTGYYGRIGVYEVMEISPHLVELIARKAPADVLRETAISEGMSTLKHSARRLVAQGITSISEIQRISTDELGLLEDGAVAEGEL
jgi:type IV pilus assembly protein PilB